MEGMFKDNEQVLLDGGAENKEFESELTETNATTEELDRKEEEDPHLWDAEKRNSEGLTTAELETHPILMAMKKKTLSAMNEDLTTEVSSMKDQVKEQNTEVLDGTSNLPGTENQRVEELMVENDRLKWQFEGLSERIAELRGSDVQEIQEQKRELKTLQGKVVKLNRELEEKQLGLTKEKEEQGRTIESLQGEIVSLREENSSLSQRLALTTQWSREISAHCFLKCWRVLELENESFKLHADLAAAILGYGEVTLQLNEIRKDRNQILNDSWQTQGEKEALDEKLMSEICKSNALDEKLMSEISKRNAVEEELLSLKFSFNGRKESAFKEKQQKYFSHNQNLDVVTEKNTQISDLQKKSSSVAKDRSALADNVKHMDALQKPASRSVNEKTKSNLVSDNRKPNRANENPKPKGVQELRKPTTKNVHGKGKPS